METNSFNNQIKNQLEQRTMEPSAKSWEQLRSKLDKKDKKNIPVYYWWIGVAASFVGGILLVSLIFNKSPDNSQIQVTENNTEIILDTEEKLLGKPLQMIESITNQDIKAEEKIKPKKVDQPVSENTPEMVVEPSGAKKVLEEKLQPFEIDGAIAETAEKIKITNVKEAEVDSLLKKALAEISERRSQNTEVISANQLLEEVEFEVERSFRERVFELLKDGFNISKDALANRNQ